jgi:hypothetical protein
LFNCVIRGLDPRIHLETVIPGREALASEPGIQRRARLLDSGFVVNGPRFARTPLATPRNDA